MEKKKKKCKTQFKFQILVLHKKYIKILYNDKP